MNPVELAPAFFAAAVVILLTCRVVCMLATRIGQPVVVGEMIAGVLLGPSLLGLLAPDVSEALFPADLIPLLYVAGQVGLVALMFHAGYEFRAHLSRGLAGTAASVSAAGALVPLGMGVGLALLFHGHADIFVEGVSAGVTAAFIGVALAITAFPMLARIITERGLSGTRHGSLSLGAGATDDAVAWLLLAGVLSVASGDAGPALITVGGTVVFVAALLLFARPFLGWSLSRPGWSEETRLLVTVVVLFAAAWFTDEIELYAVFGAFSVGMVMPRGPVADQVVTTTHSMTRVIFLPMFFTYSGLRTEFDVFTDPSVMLFGLAAVVVAIVGKFGGCWVAARLCGETNATALRVGTLMNTRGLMQLIALNIGLEAGIVGPTLFAALVLVALVTTMMTAPVLAWLDRRDAKATPAPAPAPVPAQRRQEPTAL